MPKDIIYSIWSDLTEQHSSVNDYKKESIKKYKETLIELQKKYAYFCKADYEVFTPKSTDYTNVQFDKIFKLEELTKYYDNVVYFDMDIIPITKKNIFENFNFSKIGVYDYTVKINSRETIKHISETTKDKKCISPMMMYSKVCAKNAMLMIDDIIGNENIVNTGVLCANKKSVEKLSFTERMNDMDKKLSLAIKDNLYPELMSKAWIKNNEVYLSYLFERYNIDFNNIGIQWNYILDDIVTKVTSGVHLIHQVNKDFHETISRLK